MALNEGVDYPLRFDWTSWHVLDPTLPVPPDILITGPADTTVEHGRNLVYVWKYAKPLVLHRRRQHDGVVSRHQRHRRRAADDPAVGSRQPGRQIVVRRDVDNRCRRRAGRQVLFLHRSGRGSDFLRLEPLRCRELAAGGPLPNPAAAGNNAHTLLGGDLLVATVQGIVPLSAAITNDAGQLELTMLTVTIKPMWRSEVLTRRPSCHGRCAAGTSMAACS